MVIDGRLFIIGVAYNDRRNLFSGWINTEVKRNRRTMWETAWSFVLTPEGPLFRPLPDIKFGVPKAIRQFLLELNQDSALQMMRLVLTGEEAI